MPTCLCRPAHVPGGGARSPSSAINSSTQLQVPPHSELLAGLLMYLEEGRVRSLLRTMAGEAGLAGLAGARVAVQWWPGRGAQSPCRRAESRCACAAAMCSIGELLNEPQ